MSKTVIDCGIFDPSEFEKLDILEKLARRFEPRIIIPDEVAREAHDEILRLRGALAQKP